ncbi:hypothetical protein A2630_02300 [Candidatus Woesebacteria bacterium RIFCSPHIGHO2_01_FULL_44_10]|uniref:Glycosyltransferase 2-like domain-containing protein n=1 Tax=Candidatus Woesebacteria bacterium RIFCSPLOWO2_01_FULL_44_14 TaxID=1802525 RepID=A0A1F8C2S3_9BACT|nr:MAG: hypothetical protein A2630_02300 [Candidatus Woesebacteria bacterium RIFCSPHIGHO2_01_FULL_44_10]OGM53947.1 MAG: hypothetical protein A3F62_00040 [Candidatus Woesebacteria bacterium RIFCSPHIGHO2_12_FULL_44_11]OGM69915.1 MAG: hypothetical protein A2975_04880 [Candidatus Woesebacteria bacterium RIFCSPLOWO2_01_FULL_44_14]
MKPLVSIVIVNWNGGEVFEDCLRSLTKIDYPNQELIIVDNGSVDGTQKHATIRNKENLGFAAANNQGVKNAKGRYVLLLNNDTKVKSDFLTKLVARIEKDESIGVIQPKILIMDKPTHLDSVGSFLTRTGFLQHYGYLARDAREYSREMPIFSAKGACMLVRREVIEKVGLFDEAYVSYLEETDFCWRVWLAGWKILYYPEAQILHKVGMTSKRLNQIAVNYHSFKNRLATLFKNLSGFDLILIGGTHLVIILILSFYYLARFRFREVVMIWRALFWNLSHLSDLLAKRSAAQKLRKVSDRELFRVILKPLDWKSMSGHFLRSERMLGGKHKV